MDLNVKQWFLNIAFAIVIILGVVLLFCDKADSTTIIVTMIGIPLTAYATEMGVYSHHLAKDYSSKKKK